MFEQTRIPVRSALAETFPYSRAVRIGSIITVSGTGAYSPDGQIVGPHDPYQQAVRIYQIIDDALRHFGATRDDVAHVGIHLTHIAHWEAVGRAHKEYFFSEPPSVTLTQVSGLLYPEMLVLIDAMAVIA
ncbi:MAG: RidA family protein [Anaerolineae bacterium]|jgi:enamine deaminase RidA (YjgF/YER057c/UK114 family)|nr:MAG: putative endoribonuclease L-PSP [Chloroflexi bacterium OLB13]MBC6956572.1 RidA family protein [Chloroflexota bacterium]MBV6437783.1 putative aminoacrylate peracid reductase RutC [Anaerolineae bacterium]MDL1916523.1 RidA family protein [Anaerolineae bacterium CFX4]OQY83699.1 MAG: hypothetical protein B6D42_07060 [Anaerolineae bacterium UTCFX5]